MNNLADLGLKKKQKQKREMGQNWVLKQRQPISSTYGKVAANLENLHSKIIIITMTEHAYISGI